LKKALFISRRFDLKGSSAPSRYFLDIVKRVEMLDYEVTFLKLDFETYKKKKSISVDFSNKLIIPGLTKIFKMYFSLKYIFFYKWIYKFKKRSNFKKHIGPISKRETDFLAQIPKDKYDAVFVDYFYLAEALHFFSGTKTIITHDVWHQHFSVGRSDSYFGSLTAKEEKRLLGMANLVIAISKRDKNIFKNLSLSNTNVIDLYPLIKIKQDISKPFIENRIKSNIIIFTGSNYRPNVYGLEWFLEHVWPRLEPKENNIQLKVLGNVKKYIDPKFLEIDENIEFLGYVDDLSLFYSQAKLAISPLLEGSGVKIKNIEAIEYGLPIVSTSVGAQGLEHFTNKGLFVENSSELFAKRILHLFLNPQFIEETLNKLKNIRSKTIQEQKDLSELKKHIEKNDNN
tara:strand:- start:37619 stop:38815 length:1197 start_codon:yes stop_codon:yes gene_type:complete